MIVMCHKPAQIINTARMSCDTIYLTIYNGPDLFKNFNEIYTCEHDFSKITSELNKKYYNCTDGLADELRNGIIKYNRKENTFIIINSNRTMIYDSRVGFLDLKALSLKDELGREDINKLIAYMKPLMINATDRNTINHDYNQFYFIKLLTLKGIKIQNDVLTQEVVRAYGFKLFSAVSGIIGTSFMIYNFFCPDTSIKNAGHIATAASTMLNRANTLVNVGFGEDLRSSFTDKRSFSTDRDQGQYKDLEHEREHNERSCSTDPIQEYIDEEIGILNKEGRKYINRLYEDNEEFRDEIINYV